MTAELYKIISIVGFCMAGVFLVLSIILFIKFRIVKVIGDLTGTNAKKAISIIREQNENTGNKAFKPSPLNMERGKITEKMSVSGNLYRKSESTLNVGVGTEKLADCQEPSINCETEVLAETNNCMQTSILSEDVNELTLEQDITLVHSKEIVI